jgi:hypothetical protein
MEDDHDDDNNDGAGLIGGVVRAEPRLKSGATILGHVLRLEL